MAHSLLLRFSWRLYDSVLSAIVWGALVPLSVLRILTRHATLEQLRERLGRTDVAPSRTTRILVHAVSAGEVTAAGAFVRALAEARPDWSVIMSCGNEDARTFALDLRHRVSAVDTVVSLPWDRRAAIQRWLSRLQVSAVVVVEPEIWPNLYRACRAQRIPLFLTNGRVYPRDVSRYRAARWFFADVLRVPAWIGVQTEVERGRYVAIGAAPERIEVAGSFKFDASGPRGDTPVCQQVREVRRSDCHIIVAGSTYAAEELLLVQAFEQLRAKHLRLRLVIAPRHVKRAPAIVARVRARGHDVMLASASDASPWTVLVVDRLGELAALYRTADVAFVGGTLIARGGHNVIEPARVGRATLVGPYVHHIQAIVAGLASVNGIWQLPDATGDTLRIALDRLLTDAGQRRKMGARARLYCSQNRGAARRSVDAVVSRVSPASDPVSAGDRQHATPATWPLGASEAQW